MYSLEDLISFGVKPENVLERLGEITAQIDKLQNEKTKLENLYQSLMPAPLPPVGEQPLVSE